MSDELQKEIEMGNKPKIGGKCKEKYDPFEAVKIPMKIMKPTKKPRSPSRVAQEDSNSRTVLEVQEDAIVMHEEDDTTATS